jgi:hypothetical protein
MAKGAPSAPQPSRVHGGLGRMPWPVLKCVRPRPRALQQLETLFFNSGRGEERARIGVP